MTGSLKAEGAVGWIFQANPDDWQITEYLADIPRNPKLRDTVWELKPDSYARLMAVGQRVFIWRAAGTRKPTLVPGIVACAQITGAAKLLRDVQTEYRVLAGDPKFEGLQMRVPIRVDRILAEPLTRDALRTRSDLKALARLSILTWARQKTTYPVFVDELATLQRALGEAPWPAIAASRREAPRRAFLARRSSDFPSIHAEDDSH